MSVVEAMAREADGVVDLVQIRRPDEGLPLVVLERVRRGGDEPDEYRVRTAVDTVEPLNTGQVRAFAVAILAMVDGADESGFSRMTREAVDVPDSSC